VRSRFFHTLTAFQTQFARCAEFSLSIALRAARRLRWNRGAPVPQRIGPALAPADDMTSDQFEAYLDAQE